VNTLYTIDRLSAATGFASKRQQDTDYTDKHGFTSKVKTHGDFA
jgi:hypothetical protein